MDFGTRVLLQMETASLAKIFIYKLNMRIKKSYIIESLTFNNRIISFFKISYQYFGNLDSQGFIT